MSKKVWTPEEKAAQAAKMKAYWASRKAAEAIPASLPAQPPPGPSSTHQQPLASFQPVLPPPLPPAPITSSSVQAGPEIIPAPAPPPDEEAELEAAYKEITTRKSFAGSLARFQMQELLEDNLTVQMAFKSYLRKLQAGNPLILKDHMDRVLGKATQRVELTADVTSKNLLSTLTPDQLLKLAKREPLVPHRKVIESSATTPPGSVTDIPTSPSNPSLPDKIIEVSPQGVVTHVEQDPKPAEAPAVPTFGAWKTSTGS